MNFKFVPIVEEQVSVSFTGKVNILSPFNHQYLGHFLFKDGELIDLKYANFTGVKAFYQLGIREYCLEKHQYIIEPEIVSAEEKRIHYPFSVLLAKLEKQIRLYEMVQNQRPPENVKIRVDAQALTTQFECTPEEFKVLSILTDTPNVSEIYEQCSLLEHEITSSLVNLRRKGILKIVASK